MKKMKCHGHGVDKLKLTRQNLGRVFNSRLKRACICHAIACRTKRPNLKLKTRPKQLLGSLPLAFVLPNTVLGFYIKSLLTNRTAHFKNVNNCLNTNIYSNLETYGGEIIYINIVHFFTISVN